jgi:hypothetical protein
LAGHGTVTFTDERVFYTPAANYYGPDSFTYTLGNAGSGTDTGTVTISVNAPPDAVNDTASVFTGSSGNFINVLANDTYLPDTAETLTFTAIAAPGHGVANLLNGRLLYTPNAGYIGADSFTYTISDGHGGSDTATVSVAVVDPPGPRLKVWLVADPVASGYYSVRIWAQIIHGTAGEGISDTSITICTPGSVGVTVPRQAGASVATTWNPDVLENYMAIKAMPIDSDGDGDKDAVEMSIGGIDYAMPDLGLEPVLLATETWNMMADQPVQLAVSVSGDSRHWDSATGGKVAFGNIQCDGTIVPPWPRGDVSHDNVVDAHDIDLLYAHFGANPQYDLTNDSIVTQADVDELVRNILHTNYGDANLDRKIGFGDFQFLLDHWQAIGQGWATGDFTGDGKVNFTDFQKLVDYWNPVGSGNTNLAALPTGDSGVQPTAEAQMTVWAGATSLTVSSSVAATINTTASSLDFSAPTISAGKALSASSPLAAPAVSAPSPLPALSPLPATTIPSLDLLSTVGPMTSAPSAGNLLATVRQTRYRWTTATATAGQSLGNGRSPDGSRRLELALRHQPVTAGALPGLDLGNVDLLTQLSKPVLD